MEKNDEQENGLQKGREKNEETKKKFSPLAFYRDPHLIILFSFLFFFSQLRVIYFRWFYSNYSLY